MTRVRRPAAVRMIQTQTMRIYTVAPRRLAFYDRHNDAAWIGSNDPVDLRDWR